MEGDGRDGLANGPRQLTGATEESPPRTSIQSFSKISTDKSFDSLASRTCSFPSTPSTAHTCGYDVDLEAMKPARLEPSRRTSTGGKRFEQDSSVWPGQAHWRNKAVEAKQKNRSCQCLARFMSRFSKRTRIIIQIVLALFILGAAIGVGFGISKPLGANIWQPKHRR
jgi:hypothetical protein